MNEYRTILQEIHKNVVCAEQASVLANIYASVCRSDDKNKHRAQYFFKAIEQGDECAICLEPLTYSSVLTSCGHMFSKQALFAWLKTTSKDNENKHMRNVNPFICPLCKQTSTIVFP